MQNPKAHNATLWKAILTGEPYPVRALYCQGSNMLLCYANTNMVKSALLSLDFFVVVDLFMTPTAELADIVLPAARARDPRVVQVPSHWSGKNNVNLITDNEKCAPIVGSAQLRCQLCSVEKVI